MGGSVTGTTATVATLQKSASGVYPASGVSPGTRSAGVPTNCASNTVGVRIRGHLGAVFDGLALGCGTVTGSTSTGVVLVGAGSTLMPAIGNGGATVDNTCPSGQVLVGMKVGYQSSIFGSTSFTEVQGICAALSMTVP